MESDTRHHQRFKLAAEARRAEDRKLQQESAERDAEARRAEDRKLQLRREQELAERAEPLAENGRRAEHRRPELDREAEQEREQKSLQVSGCSATDAHAEVEARAPKRSKHGLSGTRSEKEHAAHCIRMRELAAAEVRPELWSAVHA